MFQPAMATLTPRSSRRESWCGEFGLRRSPTGKVRDVTKCLMRRSKDMELRRSADGQAPMESAGGRPLMVHESGRVCGEPACATLLSKYNGSDRCALHEHAPAQRAPRRRRSLNEAAS